MGKELQIIFYSTLLVLSATACFSYFNYLNIEPESLPEICSFPSENRLVFYDFDKHQEINIGYFSGDISIGGWNTTIKQNNCNVGVISHKFINIEYLKNYFNETKLVAYYLNNYSIIESLSSNGYFLVENMNSKISLDGTFDGTAEGDAKYSSSGIGFIFPTFSSGKSYINLDIHGDIKLDGEIKTPVSIIEEKEFIRLKNNNPNDFAKCYLQDFDIYNLNGEKIKKLICGIEKNNVLVMAEMKSYEAEEKVCKTINIPILIGGFSRGYNYKFEPSNNCKEIWSEND